MLNNILILINPAAGQDLNVIPLLYTHLTKHNINADIRVTMHKGDIYRIIQETKHLKFDAVVVHGGDGTINEAIDALYNSPTPLVILPGGTANILVKELGIPEKFEDALKVISSKKIHKKKIDIGIANKIPFMLRLSTGPFADMIVNANAILKKSVGQIAYGISFIAELQNAKKITFTMTIDGEKIIEEGISIIVANSGNLGFPGISFLPSILIDDGILDIFIIKESDIGYLTGTVKDALMDQNLSNLTHLKGKNITIKMSSAQTIICDDTQLKTTSISIELKKKIATILVP